jgi:hypothetical protein
MSDDGPDPMLKKAVIVYVIIEALVLIPIVIYLLYR